MFCVLGRMSQGTGCRFEMLCGGRDRLDNAAERGDQVAEHLPAFGHLPLFEFGLLAAKPRGFRGGNADFLEAAERHRQEPDFVSAVCDRNSEAGLIGGQPLGRLEKRRQRPGDARQDPRTPRQRSTRAEHQQGYGNQEIASGALCTSAA